jgi:dihydroorotate dehydrogenase
MKLRGFNFGPVLGASGVQGFFGEGYRHHKLLPWPLRPDFSGMTFVAKTTTLEKRLGNMPMQADGITPVELFPRCIRVRFKKAVMLNAVGLSGPGAKALLDTGRWQARQDNFFISFMPVQQTVEDRLQEVKLFVELLKGYLPSFQGKVGLQINYSCPNVGLDSSELLHEAKASLQIAASLGVPLMPKFNILASTHAIREIAKEYDCDAICVSNTIPWGQLPNEINWKKLFDSEVSPLAQFGGGGLSGKPLLLLVAEWLQKAKYAGIKKPINAGGGILSPEDARLLHDAGASSVFIGSVANLRPWRVQPIIRLAHQLFN